MFKLAENGLIHSDFNEYNLMIDDSEKVIKILNQIYHKKLLD